MLYLIIRENQLIKEGYKLSNISWNQFMNNLRLLDDNTNKPIVSYLNFDSTVLDNLDVEKEKIWESLINYLKNESDENELSHDYYRLSDLPNSDPKSFLKYITSNIDLPDSFSEDVLTSLKSGLDNASSGLTINEKTDLLLLKKLIYLLVEEAIKIHNQEYVSFIQRLEPQFFKDYYQKELNQKFNNNSSYRNINTQSATLFARYEDSITSSNRIDEEYIEAGYFFVNLSILIKLQVSGAITFIVEEEVGWLQEAIYLAYEQMYYYIKNSSDNTKNILYNDDFTDYNAWVYDLLNLTGKTIEDLEQSSDFWNYSLNSLIKYIIGSFDPDYIDDSIEIVVDENNKFKIGNIKKANAANSFEADGEWVHSWINGQGQSYSQVRGNDKNISALTNKKYLQETNNVFVKLLMPQYERNVEIEDLNRNFWVIGQSLAGISAFLFSAGSPFTKTFQGIIKEIIDIWENILYLWIAFAISMQAKKEYIDIHEEVVYLNQNNYQNEFKYDNFDNNTIQSYIENNNLNGIEIYVKNKIDYLKAKYPTCHLCIIPVIRLNNYSHNYYTTEYYPGVFLYNRNIDTDWEFLPFNITDDNTNSIYASIITTSSDINNAAIKILNISSIGITNNNLNDVYYFGTSTKHTSDAAYIGDNPAYLNYYGIKKSNITYYRLARIEYGTKANFEHSTICTYENNELIFNSFKLTIHDIAAEIQGQLEYIPIQVEWYREDNSIKRNTITNQYYTPPQPFYNQNIININSTTLSQWPLCGYDAEDFDGLDSIAILTPIKIETNNCGFYMGELLSYRDSFYEEIVET